MGWVTASSPQSDWNLDRAWDAANQGAAAAGVPLKVQLRLTACVCDLLTMATLVRELMALETARSRNRMEMFDGLTTVERVWDERQYGAQRWSEARRLGVSMKALYMFARSFHDAAYLVLLHAMGTRSAGYVSLAKGIKNEESPLRKALDRELPGFVPWFLEARDIRNELKLGVGFGYGSRARGADHTIAINLEGVRGDPPSVGTVRELKSQDVERLVEQSARFMEFVAHVVKTGSLPTDKTEPQTDPPV